MSEFPYRVICTVHYDNDLLYKIVRIELSFLLKPKPRDKTRARTYDNDMYNRFHAPSILFSRQIYQRLARRVLLLLLLLLQ